MPEDAQAIAAAPEDIRWLVERVERYEATLRQIIDHEPPFHALSEEQREDMKACVGCAEARERKWPPSHTCDKHYRMIAGVNARNTDEQHWQHGKMRDIARQALTQETAHA